MEKKALRLRGKLINEDVYGNISLTDIWWAAGRPRNHSPAQWMSQGSATRFISVAYDKIVAMDHNKEKIPFNRVCYAKRGRNGVSFAHPLIAAKYAGYLDARLEVQIVEVWLRYRAGDPTLADEILERASAEANEWAAHRAIHLDSTWIIVSDMTAAQIRDDLSSFIDTDDELLVVKTCGVGAWHGFNDRGGKWLLDHL